MSSIQRILTTPPAAAPTAAAPAPTVAVWQPRLGVRLLLLAGLALLALLPRILTLHLFLDSDEINFWMPRSQRFLEAMQHGAFADTAQSTHPGVTTMWLGSAGILLRRTLLAWGVVESMPFPLLLTLSRLPIALVHTFGVLGGYLLLHRLFATRSTEPAGAALALLAAVFWATDPFVVAYARILHVDGLTSTFATLSLLAAGIYWVRGEHPAFLVLSAALGALATLSKSPGLGVVPIVGLAGLAAWHYDQLPLRRVALALLAWGAVFAATCWLAYPALWVDPLRAWQQLRVGVAVEGGSPHVIGNFFLGQETDTPDMRYYAVALALRSTPLTLIGLLLLPLVWRRDPASAATRRMLGILAAYILLFVLAMSLFPKKLNRYSVPVFPALDILAATGWVWALLWLRAALPFSRLQRPLLPLGLGMLTLLAALNMLWWHPYGVIAYNQLLGGAPRAERTFLIGDGEGLGEAAAWLNQQPDITGVRVASTMTNSLQPFLRAGAQSTSPNDGQLAPQDGYVLIYVRHTQRGTPAEPFGSYATQHIPIHTVEAHGVRLVSVYQVAPPVPHLLDTHFGEGIVLRGYGVDSSGLQVGQGITLTVQWQASAPPAQDYLLFAHLLDTQGQKLAQIDVPPAGADQPTSAWQAGRYLTWHHPLPVPADLPAGDYWLSLGLYDPANFARLPVAAPLPANAPDAGGNALLLPITLEARP